MKQLCFFCDILPNILLKDKEMNKITIYLTSYETNKNELTKRENSYSSLLTNNWRINYVRA